MKEYEFNLDEIALTNFFIAIRSKVHVIEILMEALKYMIINPSINGDEIKGKMILKIDKMSRIFFFTQDKYFSLVFPFFVTFESNEYTFYSNLVNRIDNKLISQIIEIIKCDEFKTNCSLDFVTPICEFEENCNEFFWAFLRELLLMEDGYIRYDFDPEHFSEYKKRGEEHKHPENHYDLFYSAQATFKLGLENKIKETELIDLLNINTNCKYLTNPRLK